MLHNEIQDQDVASLTALATHKETFKHNAQPTK